MKIIGTLTPHIQKLIGCSFSCSDIYQSKGLIKHVRARHPNIEKYIYELSNIISSPDFVGQNPKTPNKIEFVKRYDKNILVGIVLDSKNNYLYVATIYDISEFKLQNRLHSGRLKYLCP